MTEELVAAAVGLLITTAMAVRYAQLQFYKSYFDAKQRDLGKDPTEVLRKTFPRTWRLMR